MLRHRRRCAAVATVAAALPTTARAAPAPHSEAWTRQVRRCERAKRAGLSTAIAGSLVLRPVFEQVYEPDPSPATLAVAGVGFAGMLGGMAAFSTCTVRNGRLLHLESPDHSAAGGWTALVTLGAATTTLALGANLSAEDRVPVGSLIAGGLLTAVSGLSLAVQADRNARRADELGIIHRAWWGIDLRAGLGPAGVGLHGRF